MEQIATGEFLAHYFDLLQASVVVERHRGVEHEVRIDNRIHAAVREEDSDMPLKLVADAERMVELVDERLLFGSQAIGVGGIDRRERAAAQRIGFAVQLDGLVFKINAVQNPAALHLAAKVYGREIGA